MTWHSGRMLQPIFSPTGLRWAWIYTTSTHVHPAPLLVNQLLARLRCPIAQPHRTSDPNIASTPFSIVDPGMMAPVTGLWVNVGIVMSAKDAMVNTPLPTVPFAPTTGLSAPGLSLHPGENTVGVNKVVLQVAAPSYVNTVSSSLTVPCSTFAFTGVDSQQKIGLRWICSSMIPAHLHWLCCCISLCYLLTKFLL